MTAATLLSFEEALEKFDPALGLEVHVELNTGLEDVLRLPDRIRRRAEHAGLPDLPGPARRDARGQPGGGRGGDPDRAGPQLRDRRVVPVRAEELLLPGHAEELPDLPVRRADRLRGLDRRRGGGGGPPDRDRARPHGGGHRQVPPRRRRHRSDPRRGPLARRLQPRRHPADRDRHQADHRHRGEGAAGGPGVRPAAARADPRARGQRGPDGPGQPACRRQPVAGPHRQRRPRHPHRDQERQLLPLRRAGGPLRGAAARRRARRRRVDHPGDASLARGHRRHDQRSREVRRRGLPLLPRTRPRARRSLAGVGRAAAGRRSRRRPRRSGPGCRPSGASPTSRCATPSAPAR